jgi:2Fe-2S ferredoxin
MILRVTDREGREHALEAPEGWRVMEVIRDRGQEDKSLAIKAECGGACACATCHVYVDMDWMPRLPEPSAEEKNLLLDEVFGTRPNSRLSCQIITSEELDGLKVALAPGSEP